MSPELILIVTICVSLLIGTPIGIAIGFASVAGLLISGLPLSYIAKTAYTSIDSFSVIAVPMFILSGALMERGGLTLRLIDFSKALVGKASGGLAIVTVVACTLFAAISGSGPATTAAIGSILIPAMISQKYDRGFAGGVAACSGGIGVVIPPSILMSIYGITAEQSITSLFIAGIFPGFLLAAFLIITILIISNIKGYAGSSDGISLGKVLKAANDAKWALLAPVIILGGIYGGVFTITEASIVSVLYALFAGFVLYRDLNWHKLIDANLFTARVTGSIFIVLFTGVLFGRLLTIAEIPQTVSNLLISSIKNPIVLILLINALLLFIGMWMESITQIIILTPLLLPAVMEAGIHPIQFGVMFTIACEIGYETPPLGVNLFVASEIAGASIEEISRGAIFLALAEVAALILVSLIPQITLVLPRALGFLN